MSVMLRSTNPEAVNEIDPNRDRRQPYVGQIVVYHMRPGEGRAGKMSAPAIVTAVEDDDHVEILIVFSADDFMTRWKIPRRTEQNPVNAWSFNDYDQHWYQRSAGHPGEPPKQEGHLTWDDMKVLHAEVGILRSRIALLEQQKPKRGRPPKSETEGGEIEGAESAADIGEHLNTLHERDV